MKKWNAASFLSGIVVALLIGCLVGSAVAKSGTQTAELTYRNIKVELDGKSVALTDANGNAVEPFIIDGTTYLPVRAVSGALGLAVGWNADTSTVILTSAGGSPATPKPSTPSATPTTGQKNALESAKSYLKFTSFSYTGLINQLEYEKYSTDEAAYAADNCGADWFEQASKSAASYLKYTSFSRQGLIEQLEYEGFTHEQAVYGAAQNGY